MEKVTREQAVIEFNQWLDAKKIPRTRRVEKNGEESGQYLEVLEAVIDGDISFTPDNEVIYKLKYPITGQSEMKELKFKFRITIGELQAKIGNIKDDNLRVFAVMSAYTGESTGMLKAMDTVDFGVASSVASFLLSGGIDLLSFYYSSVYEKLFIFGIMINKIDKDIDAFVLSIIRRYRWTPQYLETLYFDDMDYKGIVYWYNDIAEEIKDLKKK